MINPIDSILNDVADMKRDLKAQADVVRQIESQQHSASGAISEVLGIVEEIAKRLSSMERKFIEMNVIYPDLQ